MRKPKSRKLRIRVAMSLAGVETNPVFVQATPEEFASVDWRCKLADSVEQSATFLGMTVAEDAA